MFYEGTQVVAVLSSVATFFWLFQLVFSYFQIRGQRKNETIRVDTPDVSVVIPSYNEDARIVNLTLESVLRQQNVNIEVIVVDDGSKTPLIIMDHPLIRLIRLNQNCGKRIAQIEGVRASNYDWIATVDSDTILDDNALYEIHKEVVIRNQSAAGGTIYLANEKENLLTRVTSCMYWFSFYQERASQAFFGQMICCSGALSIYKKEIILKHVDDYVNQKFLGKKCSSGDDRHLTNLFLLDRHNVGWSSKAKAYTYSPDRLSQFVKQQLRWTRSHIAEICFLFRRIREWRPVAGLMHTKLLFKYAYQLAIYYAMIDASVELQSTAPITIVLLSIMVITLIKCGIAYLYTREMKFGYLLLYSIFAFFVLNPVLLYGAMTPHMTGWLTRKKAAV